MRYVIISALFLILAGFGGKPAAKEAGEAQTDTCVHTPLCP